MKPPSGTSPREEPTRPDSLVVLSTVGSVDVAERIAMALVESRLAACVNVLPGLTSIYRWKGAVEKEAEVLLVIKTRQAAFEALCQALVSMHPYEVPEVVALPVGAGHAPYLAWLDENVGTAVGPLSPRGRGRRGGPNPHRRPDSR